MYDVGMKRILYKLTDWLLKVTKYPTIQCNNTVIDIPQCKRAIAQEKISWRQMTEMERMPNYMQMYERKVKEAMALRIAGDIETFTVRTDDGIIVRADVVYRDLQDLKDVEEKRVNFLENDS